VQYTGVRVVRVSSRTIDRIYKEKSTPIATELAPPFYPNMSVVLKAAESQSALTKVSMCGTRFNLVPTKMNVFGLDPRNKEQQMLLDCLLDEDIAMNIVTGRAGTGKTICASAAALHMLIEDDSYDYVVLTKPMVEVGRVKLGAVPGDVREKFGPYLYSFFGNMSQIQNKMGLAYIRMLEEKDKIRCIPVSVMRGSSFNNAFIIADEVQSFTAHELLTLTTRVGEGSKIVLMGDPGQIDGRMKWKESGMHRLIHDKRTKESGLTSYIELIKNCRSPLVELVSEVLEGE